MKRALETTRKRVPRWLSLSFAKASSLFKRPQLAAAHCTVTVSSSSSSTLHDHDKELLHSGLLPSTRNEPRLPRTSEEIMDRLGPLQRFWGMSTTPIRTYKDDLFPTTLGRDHLVRILSLPLPGEDGYRDEECSKILQALYTAANLTCDNYHGDKVHYRGLLEFSNICSQDCRYCGIRRSMRLSDRYMLNEETIIETAKWCDKKRYGSIMLQSGEVRTKQRLKFLCKIVKRIVKETNLGVSLSAGELPDEYYRLLKQAGAKRYLLRIETTNPRLFAKIHPASQTFESRLSRLRALKAHGYMVGTGVMINLPGQTRHDLADDLLFFLKEDVDMVGMGPYILQRGTPTGDLWQEENAELFDAIVARDAKEANPDQLHLIDTYNAAMFDLTTRMIALCRILLRDANIAATTALQTIHPTGREVALMRGANILMPILTPTSHRTSYQLYEGKVCTDESASQCSACLSGRVMSAGKRIGYDEQGDPPHAERRWAKQRQQQ